MTDPEAIAGVHDAAEDSAPAGATDARITVETASYALLFVVAIVMRLVDLDWMPLDHSEAAVALPAWRAASEGGSVAVVGAPLLFNLERLALWLLGGSDPAARLMPALIGSLTVLLVAGLRPLIGRTAALSAAALLALSPLWVFMGRSVTTDTIFAATALVLVGALATESKRGAIVAPIAAALLLAADGPGLAALLAFVLLVAAKVLRGGIEDMRDAADRRWPTTADRRTAAAVFVVTLVLAATGLLLAWSGVAALIELPARWLATLTAAGAGPLGGFTLPLVVYAPVIALFGVVGAFIAVRTHRPFHVFLALWVLLAVLLGLVSGSPSALGQAALPLTIAAGVALGAAAESLRRGFRWHEDGVMTAILLLILSYALIQALAYVGEADSALGVTSAVLAGGAVAMALLLLLVFGLLWGWSLAGRVAAMTALVALGVLSIANGVHLNHRETNLLREAARPMYVAPGAMRLSDAVSVASWSRTRDPHEWTVAADPGLRGTLAWALKDRQVIWTPASGTVLEPAVVVPSTSDVEMDSGVYRGQTHVAAGLWEPSFESWHAFLRWYLQRAPSDPRYAPALTNADLYISLN